MHKSAQQIHVIPVCDIFVPSTRCSQTGNNKAQHKTKMGKLKMGQKSTDPIAFLSSVLWHRNARQLPPQCRDVAYNSKRILSPACSISQNPKPGKEWNEARGSPIVNQLHGHVSTSWPVVCPEWIRESQEGSWSQAVEQIAGTSQVTPSTQGPKPHRNSASQLGCAE